jgi:transposase-like protein
MRKPTKPKLVRSPDKIAVLASPIRQEIVDTLESLGGEASVADLAHHLGRHADGLYFHLRQLTQHGLLRELEGDTGARRYRTAAPLGKRLSMQYTAGQRSNVEPVARVVAGLLRIARRDFIKALRSDGAVTSGPRRNLWGARVKGWLSDSELVELNHLLTSINDLMHLPKNASRTRLLSITWVMAPLPKQPLRRGESKVSGRRGGTT